MSKIERVERGVMVIKNGKAWGTSYSDGRETCFGWVHPSVAHVYPTGSIRSKLQATHNGAIDLEELKSGELVKVERLTTVSVL